MFPNLHIYFSSTTFIYLYLISFEISTEINYSQEFKKQLRSTFFNKLKHISITVYF